MKSVTIVLLNNPSESKRSLSETKGRETLPILKIGNFFDRVFVFTFTVSLKRPSWICSWFYFFIFVLYTKTL